MAKIDQDVDVLAAYYHNLGFLTATVGRRIEYDDDGKWITVNFVINEGPRFQSQRRADRRQSVHHGEVASRTT